MKRTGFAIHGMVVGLAAVLPGAVLAQAIDYGKIEIQTEESAEFLPVRSDLVAEDVAPEFCLTPNGDLTRRRGFS